MERPAALVIPAEVFPPLPWPGFDIRLPHQAGFRNLTAVIEDTLRYHKRRLDRDRQGLYSYWDRGLANFGAIRFAMKVRPDEVHDGVDEDITEVRFYDTNPFRMGSVDIEFPRPWSEEWYSDRIVLRYAEHAASGPKIKTFRIWENSDLRDFNEKTTQAIASLITRS